MPPRRGLCSPPGRKRVSRAGACRRCAGPRPTTRSRGRSVDRFGSSPGAVEIARPPFADRPTISRSPGRARTGGVHRVKDPHPERVRRVGTESPSVSGALPSGSDRHDATTRTPQAIVHSPMKRFRQRFRRRGRARWTSVADDSGSTVRPAGGGVRPIGDHRSSPRSAWPSRLEAPTVDCDDRRVGHLHHPVGRGGRVTVSQLRRHRSCSATASPLSRDVGQRLYHQPQQHSRTRLVERMVPAAAPG